MCVNRILSSSDIVCVWERDEEKEKREEVRLRKKKYKATCTDTLLSSNKQLRTLTPTNTRAFRKNIYSLFFSYKIHTHTQSPFFLYYSLFPLLSLLSSHRQILSNSHEHVTNKTSPAARQWHSVLLLWLPWPGTWRSYRVMILHSALQSNDAITMLIIAPHSTHNPY